MLETKIDIYRKYNSLTESVDSLRSSVWQLLEELNAKGVTDKQTVDLSSINSRLDKIEEALGCLINERTTTADGD